ncbi:MAG: glycoside hydrolase family 28 protein [Treponema sp.]|nr:glycoside hydrolase family 28 protein [Treponema sp.]
MFERNITSFGAIGDGRYDNSEAFSAACNAVKEAGGGILHVSAGIWKTGPLELFSNTSLVLEENSVISFIPDPDRYKPVWTRWEGVECYGMHPLVFADNQERIRITGKGAFDGSGAVWWAMLQEKRKNGQKSPATPGEQALSRLNPGYEKQPSGGGSREMQFLRPPLVQFRKCASIYLEGFSLRNSPFWTLHPVFCTDVTIRDIHITNPADAPNTDGMDIDSCENVLIERCEVAVGDDGIAIKSGSGEDGIKANKPSQNIAVRRCIVKNGHGGIVIGSETAAGIFNVTAEHCLFQGTDRGIRIKTRRGRGGQISNLHFKHLTMENNLCPVVINMFYRCGAALSDGWFTLEPLPVVYTTPSIKNVVIEDIKATGCRASAGFIAGLPESPVRNLSISDSEFATNESDPAHPDESDMFLGLPEASAKSFRVINAYEPVFSNVKFSAESAEFDLAFCTANSDNHYTTEPFQN